MGFHLCRQVFGWTSVRQNQPVQMQFVNKGAAMVAVDLQTSSKPEGASFVCHFHFLKSLARARSGLSDWLPQLQVWSSVTVRTAMTGMSLTDAAKGVKLSLCAHARAHACVVAPLQVRDVHVGTFLYKRHRTGRVRHANCLISVIFMVPLTAACCARCHIIFKCLESFSSGLAL